MADGAAIAASGMHADMQRIAIISQNLSNVLTPGYKRLWPVAAGFGALMAPDTGSPAAGIETSTDFRSAPSRRTGNVLDLAIEGEGYFVLQDAAGALTYTRQGRFMLDANGRLVAPGGLAVAGVSGEIRLESDQPRIDRSGRIFDRDTLLGQIRLQRFDDPHRLAPAGPGRYAQGTASPGQAGESVRIRQGHVEASNVIPADEMVRLIETMRRFEGGQKVIQWYDDMLEQALSRLGQY